MIVLKKPTVTSINLTIYYFCVIVSKKCHYKVKTTCFRLMTLKHCRYLKKIHILIRLAELLNILNGIANIIVINLSSTALKTIKYLNSTYIR